MSKDRIITQKDVAERAGVSRGVVSYVINNGPREVAPETRDRVLAAIHDLEYRPNKHAQRLKRGGRPAYKLLGIVAGGQSSTFSKDPITTSYWLACLKRLTVLDKKSVFSVSSKH